MRDSSRGPHAPDTSAVPGTAEEFKRQAAHHAATLVESGMVVGLGHGSTAVHAIRWIGQWLYDGRLEGVRGIPCSREVEAEARRSGIPLTTPNDHAVIDMTIDGADEVDPALNLIKGGGGALLYEKIVAQASRREVIVVDDSKLSEALGTHCALPVEVEEFGWRTHVQYLQSLGAREVTPRVEEDEEKEGVLFRTDADNLILDCTFGPISDVAKLARQLEGRAGIVEHGLFLGLATDVIVAGADGVRHLVRGG